MLHGFIYGIRYSNVIKYIISNAEELPALKKRDLS